MRFWERFLKPKKVRSVVYTCLTGGDMILLRNTGMLTMTGIMSVLPIIKNFWLRKNAVFGKSVRWLMLGLTVPEAAVIIK